MYILLLLLFFFASFDAGDILKKYSINMIEYDTFSLDGEKVCMEKKENINSRVRTWWVDVSPM